MFVKDGPPAITDRPRRVPTQARGRERVARILEAAAAEFDERGYDAATTGSIAQRAGVPIGSLYQWFPSKGALLAAIAERYRDAALAQVDGMLGEAALAAPLPALVDALVDGMASFHLGEAGYRTLSAAMLSPEATHAIAELHRGWVERAERFVAARAPGLGREEREVVALASVHAVDLIKYLPRCEREADRARLVREAKAMLLRYLEPIEREHGPARGAKKRR